jgi:hypothetical protein
VKRKAAKKTSAPPAAAVPKAAAAAPAKAAPAPAPAPQLPKVVKAALRDVRVVQRNLVYVIGLSPPVAKPDTLKSMPYFGQYGRIVKVVAARDTASSEAGRPPSCSAFITFQKEVEARAAIFATDGFSLDGRIMRCCFGTTKYCHAWLRDEHCATNDCLYLHEVGAAQDSFTRDEMVSAANGYGLNFSELCHPNWDVRNANGVVGDGGSTTPGTGPNACAGAIAAARARGCVLPPVPAELVATVVSGAPPPPAFAVPGKRGGGRAAVQAPAAIKAAGAAARKPAGVDMPVYSPMVVLAEVGGAAAAPLVGSKQRPAVQPKAVVTGLGESPTGSTVSAAREGAGGNVDGPEASWPALPGKGAARGIQNMRAAAGPPPLLPLPTAEDEDDEEDSIGVGGPANAAGGGSTRSSRRAEKLKAKRIARKEEKKEGRGEGAKPVVATAGKQHAAGPAARSEARAPVDAALPRSNGSSTVPAISPFPLLSNGAISMGADIDAFIVDGFHVSAPPFTPASAAPALPPSLPLHGILSLPFSGLSFGGSHLSASQAPMPSGSLLPYSIDYLLGNNLMGSPHPSSRGVPSGAEVPPQQPHWVSHPSSQNGLYVPGSSVTGRNTSDLYLPESMRAGYQGLGAFGSGLTPAPMPSALFMPHQQGRGGYDEGEGGSRWLNSLRAAEAAPYFAAPQQQEEERSAHHPMMQQAARAAVQQAPQPSQRYAGLAPSVSALFENAAAPAQQQQRRPAPTQRGITGDALLQMHAAQQQQQQAAVALAQLERYQALQAQAQGRR